MLQNLSTKQIQAMMKSMGMSQKEIDASRVVIEKSDGKIIIENPSVIKLNVQGKESFQITGDVHEESADIEFSEEDIKTVMEQTDCTEEQARSSLEKTNDIAESIMELKK